MSLNDFHKPKREAPLSLRLTFMERAYLEKRAGSQSLSSYIKGELFTAAPSFGLGLGAPQRSARGDQRMLAQILAKLGESSLGPRLGELANAAAIGSLYVDESVARELQRACADIAEIRILLLEALGKRKRAPTPKPRTLSEAFQLAATGSITPKKPEVSP